MTYCINCRRPLYYIGLPQFAPTLCEVCYKQSNSTGSRHVAPHLQTPPPELMAAPSGLGFRAPMQSLGVGADFRSSDEHKPLQTKPAMSKLFQIKEDDLAELESLLPQITEHLGPEAINGPNGNRIRKQIRIVQRIITDVRWNYGPPTEVERIDVEES